MTNQNYKVREVLTVQDVIDNLTELVRTNPEVAEYQLAECIYDDFAVGASTTIFPLRTFNIHKLPESDVDLYVDRDLESNKILIFN